MSRIAKYPVTIPVGVDFLLENGQIRIKGPLGTLEQQCFSSVSVSKKENQIFFDCISGYDNANSLSGTLRALVNNMVIGVTRGFEKKLSLVGVGYRAQVQGNKLNLSLGFSHPVIHEAPNGIKIETPSQTEILVKGIDKQVVGQVASEIRAYRPPEPYKGKGVRYADEAIVLKETKKK